MVVNYLKVCHSHRYINYGSSPLCYNDRGIFEEHGRETVSLEKFPFYTSTNYGKSTKGNENLISGLQYYTINSRTYYNDKKDTLKYKKFNKKSERHKVGTIGGELRNLHHTTRENDFLRYMCMGKARTGSLNSRSFKRTCIVRTTPGFMQNTREYTK